MVGVMSSKDKNSQYIKLINYYNLFWNNSPSQYIQKFNQHQPVYYSYVL